MTKSNCLSANLQLVKYNSVIMKTKKIPIEKPSMSFRKESTGFEVVLADITKSYLIVGDVEIPISYDMLDTLSNLYECDGAFERLTFNDDELETALIAAGLAFKNVRGSCGSTSLFHEIYEDLCQLVRLAYKEPSTRTWEPTEENLADLPDPIRQYIETLKSAS